MWPREYIAVAANVLLAVCCAGAAFGQPGEAGAPAPTDRLVGLLNDAAARPLVLAALRGTRDSDLLPVFLAAAQHGDERTRRLALAAAAEVDGPAAADVLRRRAREDSAAAVRSEALLQLLQADGPESADTASKPDQPRSRAADADLLVALLADRDGGVRCMAARALVQRGRAEAAIKTLEALTGSEHLATACMARVSLLAAGRREQLEPLRTLLAGVETPASTAALILDQLAEDKVAAGLRLARAMTEADSADVRHSAWRAVAALDSGIANELAEAVRGAKRPRQKLRLLALLADQPDASGPLLALAKTEDVCGSLAKLELARRGLERDPAAAVRAALAPGHPVVVDYVLGRARQDLAKGRDVAAFYAGPLGAWLQSVPKQARRMTPTHQRGAHTATFLADLGTPAAHAALRQALGGPYSGVVRATATGLLRTTNRDVCDLAAPLLGSPYRELALDAALTLGRFGDARARAALQAVVAAPGRHAKPIVALAAWYVLKIDRRSAAAADALARRVE